MDEVILTLLSLMTYDEHRSGAWAWKSLDWDEFDGWAPKRTSPSRKARRVLVIPSAEGARWARELFEKRFARVPESVQPPRRLKWEARHHP